MATERAMSELLFTYWPLLLFQDILLPIYVLHFIKLRTIIDRITCQSAPVIQFILFPYFIQFAITTKAKEPNFFILVVPCILILR